MDRTQECIKNFQVLFKCEPFPKNGSDPKMMEILQKYIFGEIFQTGKLTLRERELITVTALATMQTLPQLKAHLNAAINAGATPLELREALYQLAPFIGFPKTLNALEIFSEIMKAHEIALPLPEGSELAEEQRVEQGAALESKLFEDRLTQQMDTFPCDYGNKVCAFIRSFGLGDIFTRDGLTLTDRTMLAVVTLTVLTQSESLELWLHAARNCNNDIEKLASVIVQTMPYTGFPAAISAFKALNRVYLTHK